MKRFSVLSAFILVTALAVSASAQETRQLVLCYPGGNIKAKDAEPSAKAMVELVEKLGGWKAGTFSSKFTSKISECDKFLAEKPPFAIVSLGWWLGHRGDNLIPLAQPKIQGSTDEIFRVMVRKGTYKSLDELKGKLVTGTPLIEGDFLLKVIFAGKYKESDFELRPSNQALRSLRNLKDREVEAVVITAQQYQSIDALPFANLLEPIFESAPIPIMPVVANEKATTPEERKRFQKALTSFCDHKDGKQFCELFGIDAFVPANASTYSAPKALWK
ncbi:MAG TPA: PhnD/SsuA/transferrin family substrate-binding protein [Myxococcota bacterium]|nr:PhnD/SsuA/transferrin family substrate-binding protein [Myxococcota bacterium]